MPPDPRPEAPVDAVYLNGRVWTGATESPAPGLAGAAEPTALAVAGGRVAAVGTDAAVRDAAGRAVPVVDLGGRRVVPGLVDGHIHAVRAAASWDDELHWDGMPDVATALASVRRAAAARPAGTWIRAVGGWHPCQLAEGRAPSRAELDAAAPDHPVYVQALYDHAVLNSAALRASGLAALAGDPPGGRVQRDPSGEPTGVVSGLGAFTRVLAAVPPRTPAQERAGLAAMLRDLHAAGLTGFVDPGGFGMAPERYDALFDLWRGGGLSMRARLYVSAADAGQEREQLLAWLADPRMGAGDAYLRVLGLGEVVQYGCHDFEGLAPFEVTAPARAEFTAISFEAARRGRPMHVHAVLDSSADAVLSCWEAVAAEVPLAPLRFSLAHLDRASPATVARMRTLGVGAVLDDHLAFKAAASADAWGRAALDRAPPVGDLVAAGIPLAAGTDATRASSWAPWLALWWLVEGRSLDGVGVRSPAHRLGRAAALRAYTAGSAWLSFEEVARGHLGVGAWADFAVLDADYFAVPADRIPAISAELTVVGGRVVHSTGAVAPAG